MRVRSPARSEAPPSELGVLVETETRLDRALAEARARATASIAAAHARAAAAAETLERELEREHAQTVEASEATTQRQLRELAAEARARTARYDGQDGVRLGPLALHLAELLARIAVEEAT